MADRPGQTALVSVVLPIYNVEKYLNRCIKSIVNQSYKNLEIILVDDGSPDGCPELCEKWARKPANKKSSPKMSLTEEKFAGRRHKKRA